MEKKVKIKKKKSKVKKIEVKMPTPEQIQKIKIEKRKSYLKVEKQKEIRDAFFGLFLFLVALAFYQEFPNIKHYILSYFSNQLVDFIYVMIHVLGAAGIFIFVGCLFSSFVKMAELSDIKNAEKEAL